MRTQAILLALTVLPALAAAQDKVTVNFPSESPRLVFTSSGWPTSIAGTAEVKTDKRIDFDAGSVKPSDTIVVLDRNTNNVASRQVKDLKGDWTVEPQDYRYLGNVTVRVEHEGKPVAAASVAVEAKGKSQTQLIDPSSKGEAKFFALDPGEIKVQVTYRVGSKSVSTKQGFEVALNRPRVDPVLVVSLPDDVETTSGNPSAPAASSASTPSGAKPTEEAGQKSDGKDTGSKEAPRGGIGTGVAVLLGLGLALGGGYLLLQWINQNPGRLKQLGVQIPDPAPVPDGAQPMAPSQPAAPEPVQQIILGDADPTPLGVAASVPLSAPAIASGPPRLVGDGGRAFDIQTGETIVGREDGLGVSLTGESTVSRRHASIRASGTSVTVTDLGSTNGTFVNGIRLTGETTLQVGDVVQFGSVRFRYEA